MTAVHPLRPIIGVLADDSSARLLYRSESGAWIVAGSDPFMSTYGVGHVEDLQTTPYASERDALRALVSSSMYYDPASPSHVDDAERRLRSQTVSLHRLPASMASDGTITNGSLHELLDAVQSGRGEPMRAERAAAELAAPPKTAVVCPEHASPAVAAFAPVDLPTGEKYWPRELFGISDVDVLRQLRDGGRMHVRLSGPPGSGKTTMAVAAFGDDVVTVQGHPDLTVASLYGQYLPAEPGSDAAFVWADGPATRAAREGKVLFIDEANRAPKDVDDALLSLTDKRRQIILSDRPDIEPITAAPGFMVVVAYNDVDTGIRPLSASLLRRLAMHVRVDTDYDVAARLGVGDDLLQIAANLQTSGKRIGVDHDCPPAWYPQMADLEGAELMRSYGPQAMFTALTASATVPARVRDAAEVFASVTGQIVQSVAELGASSTN